MNAPLLAVVLSASRVLTLDEALETARTHQPALRQAAADTRGGRLPVLGSGHRGQLNDRAPGQHPCGAGNMPGWKSGSAQLVLHR